MVNAGAKFKLFNRARPAPGMRPAACLHGAKRNRLHGSMGTLIWGAALDAQPFGCVHVFITKSIVHSGQCKCWSYHSSMRTCSGSWPVQQPRDLQRQAPGRAVGHRTRPCTRQQQQLARCMCVAPQAESAGRRAAGPPPGQRVKHSTWLRQGGADAAGSPFHELGLAQLQVRLGEKGGGRAGSSCWVIMLGHHVGHHQPFHELGLAQLQVGVGVEKGLLSHLAWD